MTAWETWQRALSPPTEMTVSEWADEYRYLPPEASAEPGRWRTSRTPYLRAIMDALSPEHPAERVTFMKSAQIGGTEAGNNWCGYVMHHAPGPMLMVQAKDDLVEKVSKQRLTPMIDATPVLRDRVRKDNIHEKIFPGGMLMMASARSASGLRSMPIRYLFLDEVDAYPMDVQGEGDPVALAVARTRTFSRRKIFECSTPTDAGSSRVDGSFKASTQHYYHVPCPDCGAMQKLEFPNLKWSKKDYDSAHLECIECGHKIQESNKTWMLEHGAWMVEEEGPAKHLGFFINALYSPAGWYSWADIARDFDQAKNNPLKLRTFVNTVLGETWKERGTAPRWQRIYDRREPYQIGTVPAGGYVLTAGVDVQKDRLECEVVAWGPGLESWSVEHVVLEGDIYTPAPWERLSGLLRKTYPTTDGGHTGILRMAVDSGFATTEVYNWARTHRGDRVMVIKGSAHTQTILGGYKPSKSGVGIWHIGVDALKSELYAWLRLRPLADADGQISDYPAGYCHFPMYGQEYFEQLTAESQVSKVDKKGYKKLEWVKTRARNEALDLRNYARAAAESLQLSRAEMAKWERLKSIGAIAAGQPVGKPLQSSQTKRTRRPGAWLG